MLARGLLAATLPLLALGNGTAQSAHMRSWSPTRRLPGALLSARPRAFELNVKTRSGEKLTSHTGWMDLRGGGGGDSARAADLVLSIAVLIAVSLAAHSGSTWLAAVFSTAPTGVPLSLWLVVRAAGAGGSDPALAVEPFLRACIKGTLALASFCIGSLACVKMYASTTSPALLAIRLTAVGCSWASQPLESLTEQ